MSRKLYYGVAWYPELWEEEALAHDIAWMKEVGINVVRIGEFAWSTMEPSENAIDLTFFVQIIERLHAHGIDTIMCTPTATPPIWLSHGHPERMHVNERGEAMGHGSRQHACTNNGYFRTRSALITKHIAEAVGNLPGLIGWQLDNEFKAHVSECLCESCLSLWHNWLEDRYGRIERLNENWGTAIWSQRYESFEQVPQPGLAPFLHNASLKTMYQLFSMEKIAEFAGEQAAMIRSYSAAPITHNSSIAFHVDNEKLFQGLDFASYDTYASASNYAAYLINCDLWRTVKRGTPFWIMETSPSFSGSLESCSVPHPGGYVRAEAVAAYALGAEGFCYWHWRQHRTGCEQPHGSVLSAWGKPTIGFKNVLEASLAKEELEPLLLATVPMQAEAAMTYSDRAKAFFRTEPLRKLNYRGLVTEYYSRLLEMGIHRELIMEGAELRGYKLLLTPFLPSISPVFLERALAFVRNGGIWIAGPLTGGRTEEHTIHTNEALGQLEKLAGVETVYTYPIDGTGTVGQAFGLSASLGMWSAVFEPREPGAKSIGKIRNGGVAAGLSFITERAIGKGKLVLLGSMPVGEDGDAMLKRLFAYYAGEAGLKLRTDATSGTIVAPRQGDGYTLWVIVNMDGAGGSVTLPQEGTDALTQARLAAGQLTVGSYEYRIIRFAGDGCEPR
ncbi:beta-galactosidase [Paenibacillus harenae]|uniref:Beta-galactosidase n=1 Tax=Paenibacillus harenae TaxID=306543 RepID=A0ABT9TZC5_PAEHA|nr:beta-galactosidase [Paenibacillus harenae]MDQ0112727.1 beta-galactosidase [Paenibacillus harenae]